MTHVTPIISPLRQRMLDDMRKLAPKTQSAYLGNTDLIGRNGGEEFVVLLPGRKPTASAPASWASACSLPPARSHSPSLTNT